MLSIVAIYKNKGDRVDYGKSRGISLLSVGGKILARVVLNRLLTHVALLRWCYLKSNAVSAASFHYWHGLCRTFASRKMLRTAPVTLYGIYKPIESIWHYISSYPVENSIQIRLSTYLPGNPTGFSRWYVRAGNLWRRKLRVFSSAGWCQTGLRAGTCHLEHLHDCCRTICSWLFPLRQRDLRQVSPWWQPVQPTSSQCPIQNICYPFLRASVCWWYGTSKSHCRWPSAPPWWHGWCI